MDSQTLMNKLHCKLRNKTWPELEDIAEQSGVHPTTILYWQCGLIESPKLCNFVAVCETLGIKITAR